LHKYGERNKDQCDGKLSYTGPPVAGAIPTLEIYQGLLDILIELKQQDILHCVLIEKGFRLVGTIRQRNPTKEPHLHNPDKNGPND